MNSVHGGIDKVGFSSLSAAGGHRCILLNDEPSGLQAIVALDSIVLGPAVGGVRTARYDTEAQAMNDAVKLARAMTLKCSIAGLEAGGGKTVVIERDGLDRAAAFRKLGKYVQDLGGLYYCAGDLGTTREDLENMASETQYVTVDDGSLGDAVADGVLNCMLACAEYRRSGNLEGLRVAVQGCGSMGAALARRLAARGVRLILADVVEERAFALARELGASVVPPPQILVSDVDIISPCASGGVITHAVATDMKAWALCGAANNQLASPALGERLGQQGVLVVPDFLASAGAVILGMAETTGGPSAQSLIDGLGDTTLRVLKAAYASGASTMAIAQELALERIATAEKLSCKASDHVDAG
jgi:leucine dehydrogenase